MVIVTMFHRDILSPFTLASIGEGVENILVKYPMEKDGISVGIKWRSRQCSSLGIKHPILAGLEIDVSSHPELVGWFHHIRLQCFKVGLITLRGFPVTDLNKIRVGVKVPPIPMPV